MTSVQQLIDGAAGASSVAIATEIHVSKQREESASKEKSKEGKRERIWNEGPIQRPRERERERAQERERERERAREKKERPQSSRLGVDLERCTRASHGKGGRQKAEGRRQIYNTEQDLDRQRERERKRERGKRAFSKGLPMIADEKADSHGVLAAAARCQCE